MGSSENGKKEEKGRDIDGMRWDGKGMGRDINGIGWVRKGMGRDKDGMRRAKKGREGRDGK